ncbi:DNA alkylation repair protein [Desulfuribacillus alkaliarsenatis]|uniref:DNA alkylation repair protein n=1 Tax=Desulfuribacillus alkaliarsenatis TaxID=766136 RepID=A0A1E5G281_9FIRM|nr:DNA alkylation repair protein [Desulfuribacillus alkaliarsenatis]OEF97076.1 hypothetical protein BHF68_05605 [Desulfuribacillus alkaliarsenatis]
MLTAEGFIKELQKHYDEKELVKIDRFFKGNDYETKALGVRFGNVFAIAKTYKNLTIEEIEKLLDSNYYEVRMGAVTIMRHKARQKQTTEEVKEQLYHLYFRRHDRINNWDLVDAAAADVIGGYLYEKDRSPLYQLAQSENVWERRTAIVSTHYFIKQGDVQETFALAEILRNDDNEYINKAVGSWVREAGKKDEKALLKFLESYASSLPRVTLRFAVEKLSAEQKKYYMSKKEN